MLVLALDFGGTKLTAATLRLGQRRWQAHKRVFSPPDGDAAFDIETMIAAGRELLSGEQAAAVGVSFGGPVDFAAGRVRLSHHVPGWEDTPLREILQEAFGAPAVVDNDANVAALGELHYGAGQGLESLLYLTVSTGVGGGWILNGRPWRGAGGMAGEIGHTVVDPAGPLCLCGKRGCVERLASGPYMAADAQARLAEATGAGQILRRLWQESTLEAVDGRLLARAAELGDDVARAILLRGARALGTGIGNALNLVNPQAVILGGGVTKAGSGWWAAVSLAARRTTLPEVAFTLLPAALGDDAPLWGAAALAELSL